MQQFKFLYEMLTNSQQQLLIWVIVCACLIAVLEALGIVAIFYFISLLAGSAPEQFGGKPLSFLGFEIAFDDTVVVGLFVLMLILCKNIFALWNGWFQSNYISFVRHSLSTRLLSSILHQEYSYFLNVNTEVLKARFLTDVDRITDGYLRGFLSLVSESLVAIAIIFVLSKQDLIGTFVVLGLLGVVAWALYISLKKISSKSSHDYTAAQHVRYFIGGTMLTGIKYVKAGCTENFFYKIFSDASKSFSKIQVLQNMVLHSPRLVIETFAICMVVLGLILVGAEGDGIEGMLPTLALYAAAAYRLLPSLNRVVTSLQQIKFSEEPVTGIHKMLISLSKSAIPPNAGDTVAVGFDRQISLEHVFYQFSGAGSPALDDLSFKIWKNEFVGIAGASGAGKSTLIDILLGLLHPSSGLVSVDDRKITSENAGAWRKSIGYVPQSIFLMDDSVANNIAFGRGGQRDMAEVRRVAKLAQIDEFICNELADGYETWVGENGVRLSGGQRQRLGIARALYGGVDILLLDEATSALDSETEKDVTNSILSLTGKITLIVVAHRLSTIKQANKILLLEGGKLLSEGAYDELVDQDS
jgi:ATP-binding cassette, subfamily B, bacterial PglK